MVNVDELDDYGEMKWEDVRKRTKMKRRNIEKEIRHLEDQLRLEKQLRPRKNPEKIKRTLNKINEEDNAAQIKADRKRLYAMLLAKKRQGMEWTDADRRSLREIRKREKTLSDKEEAKWQAKWDKLSDQEKRIQGYNFPRVSRQRV